MMYFGCVLVGLCFGIGIGMIIMAISDARHIKEISQLGIDGINDVANIYKAELRKKNADILRMQGIINELQIEKAKAKMETDLPKAPEIMPDWLKDFYDTSKVPEGNDDFGGITL